MPDHATETIAAEDMVAKQRKPARTDAVSIARRGRGLAVCSDDEQQVYAIFEKILQRAEALEKQRDEMAVGTRWANLQGQVSALYWVTALLTQPQKPYADPETSEPTN